MKTYKINGHEITYDYEKSSKTLEAYILKILLQALDQSELPVKEEFKTQTTTSELREDIIEILQSNTNDAITNIPLNRTSDQILTLIRKSLLEKIESSIEEYFQQNSDEEYFIRTSIKKIIEQELK